MSSSPGENSPNYLNIRLKHPDKPKKEPTPPQSPARIQHKFENYELERQQKLKRLREEYEEKERESMTPCTKPFKIYYKTNKQSKNSNRSNIFNDEQMKNGKTGIDNENNQDMFDNNNWNSDKSKKKVYSVDDSNLVKNKKYRERKAQENPEFWDEDGNLINKDHIQFSQSYTLQNEDDFYTDITPSPKRVRPKGKYPSLVERATIGEKNKTSDSSVINSPSSTQSNSPYSMKSNSAYYANPNSPFSTKSVSSRSTTASFKEFEERQQKILERRRNKQKEAEQKIIEEANRSYTLPKSQELYKKRMQRKDEPIKQRKYDDDEITFSHIPDTSISRKRFKDHPLGSAPKEKETDSAPQESTNKNEKNKKSFKIEDIEAQYIAREVKLRSMEIEEECNKIIDCTFTPEKFTNYKISSKPLSPENSDKYIKNADKQMARSRLSGQKIREENQNKDDDHYVHKTTKIPNSTKKLMNIVSKLKKEENDERYNQKNDSLYDRSVATMQRRNGKSYSRSLITKLNKSDYDYVEEEEDEKE